MDACWCRQIFCWAVIATGAHPATAGDHIPQLPRISIGRPPGGIERVFDGTLESLSGAIERIDDSPEVLVDAVEAGACLADRTIRSWWRDLPGACCGEPYRISSGALGFDIAGWTQFGYHSDRTGAPGTRLFNNNPGRINAHQMWIYADKPACGDCGPDWGFHADLVFGTDGPDAQSFGNDPGNYDFLSGWDRDSGYGWSMPQLYATWASGDLTLKAGHFFTLPRYEVVAAPANFFYSHAYTMFNSEPFTHTGLIGTYQVRDNTEAYFGWTYGWDTGFDRRHGGSSFLGGLNVELTRSVAFRWIATIGDFGNRGEGYAHSIILDFAITRKLNYVFQTDLVDTNTVNDTQFGLNQYLIYTVHDCLGVGMRAEWWKNFDQSYGEVTLGANIRPHPNVIVRPELRHDWSPQIGYHESGAAIDMIVLF